MRGERLRLLLSATSGMPVLPPEELLAHAYVTDEDAYLLASANAEDLALVNACLEVEQELRQRAYAAVERLLAHAAGKQGALDERLRALPLRPFADAATCLYELGWVMPSDDDGAA